MTLDIGLLARGALLGLSIAAPVGPIGVLCIRRTLADGRRYGLASGLGAATADACYGALAAFGLTALSSLLLDLGEGLRLGGGLLLCWLGLKTILAAPAQRAAESSGAGLLAAYASTFVLTLSNPLTILSFLGIFAGAGLSTVRQSVAAAGWLVAGVFLGSALWWLLLSGGVSLLRARLDERCLRWVNRLSGAVILGFGLLALSSLVFQ